MFCVLKGYTSAAEGDSREEGVCRWIKRERAVEKERDERKVAAASTRRMAKRGIARAERIDRLSAGNASYVLDSHHAYHTSRIE